MGCTVYNRCLKSYERGYGISKKELCAIKETVNHHFKHLMFAAKVIVFYRSQTFSE